VLGVESCFGEPYLSSFRVQKLSPSYHHAGTRYIVSSYSFISLSPRAVEPLAVHDQLSRKRPSWTDWRHWSRSTASAVQLTARVLSNIDIGLPDTCPPPPNITVADIYPGTVIPNYRLNVNVMLSNIIFLMIFCGFWSVAVNTMDKLQFLELIFAVLLSKLCNMSFCNYKVY